MTRLKWDEVGDRVYETGLDRGVLYLPDGSAVPWNGLTAIIEAFNKESSPVYYEGMKINDLLVLGDFAASMKAVTYPDEFVELEGLAPVKRGLFYADQKPKSFGLCYRTQIGNDLEGDSAGYKVHILYNVTAIPNEKTYASVTSDPSLVEFEWTISAVPEEIEGFRPTAHIIIDSRDLDPWLLEELEEMLYGSSNASAALLPMSELAVYIAEWYRIRIIDNGDGTWTAISRRAEQINIEFSGFFEIFGANAVFLNDYTFLISDTTDASEVPEIKITDLGNGDWNATTDHDNLIVPIGGDLVEIRNANVVFVNPYTYLISDTTDED